MFMHLKIIKFKFHSPLPYEEPVVSAFSSRTLAQVKIYNSINVSVGTIQIKEKYIYCS